MFPEGKPLATLLIALTVLGFSLEKSPPSGPEEIRNGTEGGLRTSHVPAAEMVMLEVMHPLDCEKVLFRLSLNFWAEPFRVFLLADLDLSAFHSRSALFTVVDFWHKITLRLFLRLTTASPSAYPRSPFNSNQKSFISLLIFKPPQQALLYSSKNINERTSEPLRSKLSGRIVINNRIE